MIQTANVLIVAFLVLCALAVANSRTLMASIILFSAYGAGMSILWLTLTAPDVAITEAAIGTGVTTVVFVAVVSQTAKRVAKPNSEESGDS